MKKQEDFFLRKSPPHQSARMVEAIYGCKWSLTVYHLLAHGINRPGEMVRSVEGLTTKVLNACLRKNLEFGILEKQVFNELPPRVEYRVTPFGERFMLVLEQLESLQQELESRAADSA
jgi:DNA-binding HxlR family transcriptional regulator